MSKARDFTGIRFGRLTVIRPTEERKNGMVVWECRCDCGNIAFVSSRFLKEGSTKSCGCLKKLNLAGKQFGRLIAIKPTEKRLGSGVVWECKCDCGNTTFVAATLLTKGHIKSCGCGKKVDLTGMRFGKLTAIKPTEKRSHGSIVWECQCDCGNTTLVRPDALKSGATQSCGCLFKTAVEERYEKHIKPNYVLGTDIKMIRAENKLPKNNTSGVKGVYFNSKKNYFEAELRFRGCRLRKICKSLEEAAEERRKMKQIHEEFLEWWESLSEGDKVTACAEYENEKATQIALLKKRMEKML